MDPQSRPIKDVARPGTKADGPLLRNLRNEVAQLLHRQQTSFPGAQPVSFARRHLDELKRQDYYVCEKSDGIRYLLYLTDDGEGRECHYLIDRKNDYWWLHQRNLHLPLPGDPAGFHTGTLLDGELVMEKVGDGDGDGSQQEEPRFLVFDLLALDGKADVLARSLDKRLGYAKEHVMRPYDKLFQQYPDEQRYQAFRVVMKSMQVSYGIEMMFREVLPTLRHGNDGLIFTCRNSPYQFGTDQHIVKWKPPKDNSVDFRVSLTFPTVEPTEEEREDAITEPFVDYDSVPPASLWVYHGSGGGGGGGGTTGGMEPPAPGYKLFSDPLYLSEDEWETLKSWEDPIIGRVVECVLDDEGRWRLHRFRDDKPEGNHVSVVNSVLESIRDRVTEDDLLAAAKGIKDNWKTRLQGGAPGPH